MKPEKYHMLQIKERYGELDVRIQIPNGFTAEQANEIGERLNEATERYGEEHCDYDGFNTRKILETILEEMDMPYENPPVDYTIYTD